MTRDDIAAMSRAFAPVMADLLRQASEPLLARVAELERQLPAFVPPAPIDPAPAVREIVGSMLPDIVAAAVREAVDAIPPAAPGRDADPAEVARMVDEAVAALPPAKDGEPGRDVDLAVVREMIAGEVAKLPPPADGKDADPAEIQRMVNDAVAALPPPRDGKDADPEVVRAMVADAVAALPPPVDGKDADPAEVERLVTETVERALAGWERPRDGTSVTIDDVAPMIEARVAEAVAHLPPAEPGREGPPGKLGIVSAWEDRVHYEADVVTFDGALYQAQRDTGRAPPHGDWLCIVSRGEPGADAANIEITGTYDPKREYRALAVVALDGSSFIAKRDAPGPCPGDGWQLIASRGKRGATGEATKGDPGRPGPVVRSIDVDDEGLLTLTNADGTTAQCDLYPLLSQIRAT